MRILLVEDEHKIAQFLKKGLEQELHSVDIEYDGRKGLDTAMPGDYDLIILDWLLPELSGLDICKRLRSSNIQTPILMLTAKGQVTDKVEGLSAGADDYLTKPFAFEELLARINAISRRPVNYKGDILKIADLEMNTQTLEVKRQGKLIALSGKEFALLEYLLRHPNRILTKEQLITHVWSYESDILPNTVEVYIGYLRNKIDRPFATGLIHTIRGFGYKIG